MDSNPSLSLSPSSLAVSRPQSGDPWLPPLPLHHSLQRSVRPACPPPCRLFQEIISPPWMPRLLTLAAVCSASSPSA